MRGGGALPHTYTTATGSASPKSPLSIHGVNEKISVQAYEMQVKFMFELIQNADSPQESVPHLHEL